MKTQSFWCGAMARTVEKGDVVLPPVELLMSRFRERFFRLDGWWTLLVLALLAVAPLVHLHFFDRHLGPDNSDLVGRWVGTRVALQGGDPYSAETQREIQKMYYGHWPLTAEDKGAERIAFFYPAQFVILLVPLALLPWKIARLLFFLVTVVLLAASILGCVRRFRPAVRWSEAVVVLALSLLNWPLVWGLRMDQPSLPHASLLFLAWICLTRSWYGVAGVLLAIATFKPQAVLPVLVWLVVWSVAQRVWSFLVAFAVAFGALFAVTEVVVPGWFTHWRVAALGYSEVTDSALPLENLFGHWTGLALTGVLIVWSCAMLWRLRRCPPRSAEFHAAMCLLLAVTVLMIPTHLTRIYNEVLLIPAVLLLAYLRPEGRTMRVARMLALGMVALGFVATLCAAAGEVAFGVAGFWDVLPFLNNSVLPPVIAVTIAVSVRRMRFISEAEAR